MSRAADVDRLRLKILVRNPHHESMRYFGVQYVRAADDLLNRQPSPRATLAHLPTPLASMPRLAAGLGMQAPFLLKRDGCTGLATGGNKVKVRPIEYDLGDALAKVPHGASSPVLFGRTTCAQRLLQRRSWNLPVAFNWQRA